MRVKLSILILSFFFGLNISYGQVMEFDMLEMKYDQGHYKMVYRKANRLIDNPEFDFSYLPKYYRALSGLQLAQNKQWLKRNESVFAEASDLFEKMNQTIEGRSVLRAHQYEMSSLKNDLQQWAGDLKVIGDRKTFTKVEALLASHFSNVQDVLVLPEDEVEIEEIETSTEKLSDYRENLIKESKKYLGVPYKWAGSTPDGFDCSGFTSYVMQEAVDKKLQRRAVDQYNEVRKIRQKQAQPGDFIFFDNGSGISHVGIIVAIDSHSIEMIHASTSKGISIVDVNASSYWKARIAGYGTYFDK